MVRSGTASREQKVDDPPQGRCLPLEKQGVHSNVAYLLNIVLVSICKKNHVLFYHLDFICIAVTGVVKRRYGNWLKYCKIGGNIARAGTLLNTIHFSSLFGHC